MSAIRRFQLRELQEHLRTELARNPFLDLSKQLRMTREEAIALAREHWGEKRPGWNLREDLAEYREGSPIAGAEGYGLAAERHWHIPLERTVPHIGASHALIVFTRSRTVREIQWGE